MDVLGMRALARGAHAMRRTPPGGRHLYRASLAGDLAANSLYYGLVGVGTAPVRTGLLLGLAAGIGALQLPPLMGLGTAPHAHSRANQAMTIAWYALGGLVAGAVHRSLTARTPA
jgi:hypothetical protein